MQPGYSSCVLCGSEDTVSGSHLVDGHKLTLLRGGVEYFPRLVAAIDGAVRFIYVEAYIYVLDASGLLVAEAMCRAAGRGIKVHLMLDGYGCADLPQTWVTQMRAAGVQVLRFRPEISWLSLRRKRLRRLHRKLVVVDGRSAFVGGINIVDDVPAGSSMRPRLDYAVEVQGEVVQYIHTVMRRLWVLVSWTNFRRQRERVHLLHKNTRSVRSHVVFLLRDNLRHRRSIEQAYLHAIDSARREIIIASAYFLPGKRMRAALQDAVRRGVKVVLLLQGKVEYRLQHYATLALYEELLGAGVEIHEYHASFLHAKVAVVDGHWATVGSSNIDPFSLWLAREANLLVRDDAFAAALRGDLLHEMAQGASVVVHENWRKLGTWVRLRARFSLAVVRLLAGVIGYAPEQDEG